MPHPRSQFGVSLTEYGLVLSLAGCLGIMGLQSLGRSLFNNLQATALKVEAAAEKSDIRFIGALGGSTTTVLGAEGKNDSSRSGSTNQSIQTISVDPVPDPYSQTQVGASAASFTASSGSSGKTSPPTAANPYASATVLGTAGTKRRE